MVNPRTQHNLQPAIDQRRLPSPLPPSSTPGSGKGQGARNHSRTGLILLSLCLLPPLQAESTGTNDIRDIQPPVPVSSLWDGLPWALAAVVALTLLYALFRSWQRKPQPPPPLVIPPHVRARNRLRQALDLISQPKPFCILISDTLRLYLEERFHWHAPERTTEEFLAELQASTTLDPDQKRSLSQFLTRCDLVKFARLTPPESELRDLLDVALLLVEQTVPSPPDPLTLTPALPPNPQPATP